MAIRINTITVSELNCTASDYQYTLTTSVGSEQRLAWAQSAMGYGFAHAFAVKSDIPPIKVAELNDTLRLIRIRYTRGVRAEADTTEVYALGIPITISTITGSTDTLLNLVVDTVTGNITLVDPFPHSISVENFEITLLGFLYSDGLVANTLKANVADAVHLLCRVTSITETVATGPPVFAPKNCTVPDIRPIDDFLILDDCEIPPEIEPLVDCPAIDLPAVAALGVTAISGEVGPPGPPGPPGCDPTITVSYKYFYVHDCSDTRVELDTIPITECWTHFHFRFYICRPYYYPPDGGCCVWVWCPCDGIYDYGGISSPPVDNNCPKTDTCTAAPGHWVSLSGCADDPPCITGTFYGQAVMTCDCPSSSSSSSSASSPSSAITDIDIFGCCADVPDTLTLTVSGSSSCPFLTEILGGTITLTRSGSLWVATRVVTGDGADYLVDYTFACIAAFGSPRLYGLRINGSKIIVDGSILSTCNLFAVGVAECTPFSWTCTSTMTPTLSSCCNSPPEGTTYTFTVTE
jgi:hypothetical protein